MVCMVKISRIILIDLRTFPAKMSIIQIWKKLIKQLIPCLQKIDWRILSKLTPTHRIFICWTLGIFARDQRPSWSRLYGFSLLKFLEFFLGRVFQGWVTNHWTFCGFFLSSEIPKPSLLGVSSVSSPSWESQPTKFSTKAWITSSRIPVLMRRFGAEMGQCLGSEQLGEPEPRCFVDGFLFGSKSLPTWETVGIFDGDFFFLVRTFEKHCGNL